MRQKTIGFWDGSGTGQAIWKPSAPHYRQITTTTPHHAIFTGQMLFLMPDQQCQSTDGNWQTWGSQILHAPLKGKGSLYSITQRRVPELIPVLGSQPVGDASHKPGGRRPLLSARPAVTLATLTSAATNFAAWWTEARWVRTVWIRLLPENVAAAIWTQALLCLSPAR